MTQGSGEIGRVLGGRYRLVTRIGAGRFTHVFLAYDLSQSRRVAVKLLAEEVLPEGWNRDGVFSSRYLEAAEEAAAVVHPHLAAVHDWGESEIGPYVVNEYLAGGSLQGMLNSGHLLSPSQTLMVGLEVARGLEHIHRLGLVHQDVRPSNILFDGRGRSRLADLGTSSVLNSLESGGALMSRSVFSEIDAVRYSSPEQAQRLAPDQKSDVYSLVLVLTEALSGRVPFESDDPEYTQMAKMSRQLDLAGQFDRLGRVLEMAGRPERDDRPSAHDLGLALLASAGTLSRPAPLPLPKEGPEIPDTAETAAVGAPSSRSEAASAPSDAGRPAYRRVLAALVALVLLGAAGFGSFAIWERQFGTETQPVPDLSGADEAEMLRIESEFGWVLNRLDQRQDGTVAGQVLRQAPQPGTQLEEGETVTVWVSLGPELVAIPSNLAGLAVEDAETSLVAVGLSVGDITQRPDESVIAGVVIEVDELFTEVEPGSSVDLVVSLGPLPRVVPDIEVGSSLAVARERLEQVRLGVLEWRVSDNEVQVDHVVRLEPPPGTEVAADSIITVVVSTGPEQVRVPDVATLGVGDALGVLEEAGLCLGEIEGPLDSEILATNPPADTVVDFGTCVDLFTRPDEEDGESSG
ncbi:MAG: PASTA domain-containing protein [Acidimicrobiia bacterium]|nr:PASTA domain-containing protein [Acidimicrobiia bacterium]MYG59516.1 PASTA domain-containing protein [Acidimicrobiia bacterium]MYJ31600.1 PASTA domain-containing protein [Acidimicrobiia bacterium]